VTVAHQTAAADVGGGRLHLKEPPIRSDKDAAAPTLAEAAAAGLLPAYDQCLPRPFPALLPRFG
jgi:hypothetical protein